MRRKLQTARALSLDDWLTLAQAWLLLLITDWGLRVLPFPRVQAFAAPDLPREHRALLPTIQRLHRLIDLAARHHLYPMTCLRRALVLQRIARVRGADARVRIGVRKDAGALQAHAWVECDGQIVGQPERVAEKFAPLVPAAQVAVE
jgi:hypothetical protein